MFMTSLLRCIDLMNLHLSDILQSKARLNDMVLPSIYDWQAILQQTA